MKSSQTDKILDELTKEFEKANMPLLDKLTLFAKVQNAFYKCAETNEHNEGLENILMHLSTNTREI